MKNTPNPLNNCQNYYMVIKEKKSILHKCVKVNIKDHLRSFRKNGWLFRSVIVGSTKALLEPLKLFSVMLCKTTPSCSRFYYALYTKQNFYRLFLCIHMQIIEHLLELIRLLNMAAGFLMNMNNSNLMWSM